MTTNIITRVRVDKLYGLYSYDLPSDSVFSNATILYGDNGVGKSSLLRLVYHLLSADPARGHRLALNEVDFEYLEVKLSTNVTMSARRITKDDKSFLRLDISKGDRVYARWDYRPKRSARTIFDDDAHYEFLKDRDSVRRKKSEKRIFSSSSVSTYDEEMPSGKGIYIEMLEEHAPVMFILNADRRLDSDTVADPSDEVELRRLMHYDTPKSINQLVQCSREIGLTQALSRASKWISQKAIIGTNQGSTNVHSVYVDVVKRIISPYSNATDASTDDNNAEDLVNRLNTIENKMKAHAHYRLATELLTKEFVQALKLETKEKSKLAEALLKPYVQSLEKRLDAVEPIYKVIDDFVNAINVFLNDKKIEFQLDQGFRILNRLDSKLEASQLSSGEQQLLLLFCYVITARDEPSVFMIDEPEISLNIKWQRQLIQALLDITKNSEIQFIFASHSMELLAQHKDRVVKLENSVNE